VCASAGGVYKIDRELNFDSPKSHAGTRVVSLPDGIAKELRMHLELYTDPGVEALVFCTATGGVLTPANLFSAWFRARARINRPDMRFHDPRHTGQTLAEVRGATQAELMQRLGHSTNAAALAYMHATQDHSRAIAQALNQHLTDAGRQQDDAQRPSTERRIGSAAWVGPPVGRAARRAASATMSRPCDTPTGSPKGSPDVRRSQPLDTAEIRSARLGRSGVSTRRSRSRLGTGQRRVVGACLIRR